MTITPVELHHLDLKRGLFGYRRGSVDGLLEEIAQSFEETWRERAEFADRIEQLQSELSRGLAQRGKGTQHSEQASPHRGEKPIKFDQPQ